MPCITFVCVFVHVIRICIDIRRVYCSGNGSSHCQRSIYAIFAHISLYAICTYSSVCQKNQVKNDIKIHKSPKVTKITLCFPMYSADGILAKTRILGFSMIFQDFLTAWNYTSIQVYFLTPLPEFSGCTTDFWTGFWEPPELRKGSFPKENVIPPRKPHIWKLLVENIFL